ncbi:MAG TPA: sigma-70 family RNA polymerase sigma factor [Stellaceae bacterium]|nr:sigma-70 family RNA polymerase sigma factor [Stellaceae bacterium]
MARVSSQNLFETAVLPHLDAAYNLARWLMRNAEDAEDVVQEAVLRALTYFPSFRGENPRAWLLQIVRNAAYASMKLNRGRAPARGEEDDALAEIADPGDDPEATLMKAQDRSRVARLLASLPVELRETLILRELEEMSYKEVAEVTEVPIGTVMSRLWRGRRLLAKAAKAGEAAT